MSNTSTTKKKPSFLFVRFPVPLTVVETGGGREAVGEEEDHGQGSGGCWEFERVERRRRERKRKRGVSSEKK